MKSTGNGSNGASRSKTTTRRNSKPAIQPSAAEQAEHIAVAAYYRAQARGFAPGGELDDWLQAESEISTRMAHA